MEIIKIIKIATEKKGGGGRGEGQAGGGIQNQLQNNSKCKNNDKCFFGSRLSASLLSVSWVAHSNPAVSHCPQPTSTSLGGPPVLSGGDLWTCRGNI